MVGDSAFYDRQDIKSVFIGDTIQSIEYMAFAGCRNVESVTIGSNVNSIAEDAFMGLLSLETLCFLGSDEPSIGNRAFEDAGVGYSFDEPGLQIVHVSDSYSAQTFGGFSVDKQIDSCPVYTPGCPAVDNCEECTKCGENDYCTKCVDGYYLLAGTCQASCDDTKYDIVQGECLCKEGGFKACSGDDAKSCGECKSGFYGDSCEGECSVGLSHCSVCSKDGQECVKCETGYAVSGSTCTKTCDGQCGDGGDCCWTLSKVTGLLTITSGTTIGANAFYNQNDHDYIESIVIGDSIVSILNKAFYWDYKLISVTIGKGVQSFGDFAFGYCERLANVCFLGSSQPTFGGYPFDGCNQFPTTSVVHVTENYTGETFVGRTVDTVTGSCPAPVICADGDCEECPDYANVCTKCKNKFLQNGVCVENCEGGYGSEGVCHLCTEINEKCSECSDANTCTKCSNGGDPSSGCPPPPVTMNYPHLLSARINCNNEKTVYLDIVYSKGIFMLRKKEFDDTVLYRKDLTNGAGYLKAVYSDTQCVSQDYGNYDSEIGDIIDSFYPPFYYDSQEGNFYSNSTTNTELEIDNSGRFVEILTRGDSVSFNYFIYNDDTPLTVSDFASEICSVDPPSTLSNCDDENCKTCDDEGVCNVCNDEYYLVSTSCVQCTTSHCKTCENDVCSDCVSGYHIDENTCSKDCIDTNCSKCDEEGLCQICKDHYYLDGTSCKPCTDFHEKCTTCSKNDKCTGCEGKYAPSADGTSCEIDCNDVTDHCISCPDGTTCEGCESEFYLKEDGTCGACTAFDEKCTTCNKDNGCTACQTNYKPSADGSTCELDCTTITDHCNSCPDETACTGCEDEYYLDSSSLTCKPCTASNCKTCENDVCSGCVDGYHIEGNTCRKDCIDTNCSKCDEDNAVCSECKDGYILRDNSCDYPVEHVNECGYCCECTLYKSGLLEVKGTNAEDGGELGRMGNNFQNRRDVETVIFDYVGSIYRLQGSGVKSFRITNTPSFYFDSHAFQGCDRLESIDFTNVTKIENDAFYGCTGLKTVVIPESVTEIGTQAFYGCTGLENVTINATAEVIDYNAFLGCSSLKNLYISDSIKTIRDDAFWLCESLETLTIPASVTSIENQAFGYCTKLEEVTYLGTHDPGANSNDVFTSHPDNFRICVTGDYVDDSFCKNPASECSDCPGEGCRTCDEQGTCEVCMRRYYLDDTDTSCKPCSDFHAKCTACSKTDKCTGCAAKYAPSADGTSCDLDCTAVADHCISCSSETACDACDVNYYLKEDGTCGACTEFGEKCTTCNKDTKCTACQTNYKPSADGSTCELDCTTITDHCNSCPDETACTGCEDEYYLDSSSSTCKPCTASNCKTCENDVCSGCVDGYHIEGNTCRKDCIDTNCSKCDEEGEVCSECKDGYILRDNFCDFPVEHDSCGDNCEYTLYKSGVMEVNGTGTEPGTVSKQFQDRTDIETITFNFIGSIQTYAFSKCSARSVTFSNSPVTINQHAFESCPRLESVDLTGVLKISFYGFRFCGAIKTLVIPESVDWVGSNAFEGCAGLENVTINCTAKEIEYMTFATCKSLKNVYISDSIETIGRHALYFTGLETVTIPASVTSILDGAFSQSYHLEEVRYLGTNDPGPNSGYVFSYHPDNFRICVTGDYVDDSFCQYPASECSDCPGEGCRTCDEQGTCEVCMRRYYLDDTDSSCKPCTEFDAKCTACSKDAKCTACQTNYKPSDDGTSCIFNCTTITDYCNSCSDETTCTGCEDEHYLKEDGTCGACTEFGEKCTTCNKDTKCTACQTNYKPSDDGTSCVFDCTTITDHCNSCPDQTTCEGCEDEHYLKEDGTCGACTEFDEKCTTCNKDDGCTACQNKYKPSDDGTSCELNCTAITDHCNSCYDETTCTGCEDEHYLKEDGTCGACTEFDSKCTACSKDAKCTACQTNYKPSDDGTSCIFNCTTITDYCNSCSDETTCTGCEDEHYLKEDGTCGACTEFDEKCTTCNKDTKCTACQTNYKPSDDGTSCVFDCTTITDHCNSCPDQTTCEGCEDEYYLDSSSSTCKPCTASNCKTCENDVCSGCVDGYHMEEDRCRKDCIDTNCSKCDEEGEVCSECKDGYILRDNFCDYSVEHDSCGDNCEYTLYKSGLLEVNGTGTEPGTVSKQFKGRNDIETISIVSIGEIQEQVFMQSSVRSVTFSNSPAVIRYSGFRACPRLESVNLTGVTKIESFAFSTSGLKTLVVPESATEVGDDAFSYCSSLENVTITSASNTIEHHCYQYCTNLKNVYISDSIEIISYSGFYHCEGLETVTIPASVTSIGNDAFGYCNKLKEVKYLGTNDPGADSNDVFTSQVSSFRICVTREYVNDSFCKHPVTDCTPSSSTSEQGMKSISSTIDNGGSNGGMIAGIVIGVVCFGAIVLIAVFCCVTSGKKHGKIDENYYEDDPKFVSMSVL